MDTQGLIAIPPPAEHIDHEVQPRIPTHMKYQLVLRFQADSVREFALPSATRFPLRHPVNQRAAAGRH
jgi:hypothetical protein